MPNWTQCFQVPKATPGFSGKIPCGSHSSAMSRLTPTGIVIAMQARLHPGDTIGWLLNTEMKFLQLHLPATNDSGQDAWLEDQYE
jgi:hypothetical protein